MYCKEVSILSQEHDSSLIETWYHQYAEFLFRYASQFIDYHSAEEIVQETFRIVCGMTDLEQIEHPKTWLRKIASNVLKNWLRDRKKWKALLVDIDALSEDALGQNVTPTNIELEYSGLIKSQDLHLLNLLVSGLTYADAAEILHSTAEACRKRAKRAAKILEEKLRRDIM